MYNLEQEIKKINKINNLESKKSYIEDYLKNFNYNKKLEIINEIIENQKSKYNRLISVRKYYDEKNKIRKVLKINKEIVIEQQYLEILLNIKTKLKKEMKNNNYLVLELTKEQIKKIDKLISEDTYSLIEQLNDIELTSSKIEILEKLKMIYDSKIHEFKKKDISNVYVEIKLLKKMQKHINDSLKLEHKKYKKENNLKEETEEKTKLSNIQSNIINDMIENKKIDKYNLVDILSSYKYFICEYTSKYSSTVLEISKYLSTKLMEEEVVDDEIIILINSIKDTIKNRLIILDKEENVIERKVLKELRIIFDFISKNYKEDITKTKHNYFIDIIFYFMKDENGYPYLKKIIKEMPNIVNIKNNVLINNDIEEIAKTVNEDISQISYINNSDEHIVITVLKEFIINHKKMLEDKRSNFINPDYLKQIYILFVKSNNLYLNKEERQIIDKLINDYKKYIKTSISKFERQKEAKKELNALKTGNYFMIKYPKLKNVDTSQLIWQANYLKNNRISSINRHNRVDLTEEETISFNDNTSYSLKIEEDKKKLKINVLDIDCMVAENTSVDSQIYNDMIERQEMHYQILRNFSFDYNNINPCITYEITFNKNNIVSDFNIYRSNVNVSKKCNEQDLFFERPKTLNDLKNFAHKLLLVRNIEFEYISINNIEKVIENVLNEQFIKYINKNNIPFIYSGVEYINDYVNNMNYLNNIFSRLDREDFNILYKIINGNVGEFGYSKDLFNVEGEYNLNLINNINYLTLFNQRLITNIILNKEIIKTKEDYIKEIEQLEHDLNLSINHIKPEDMVFKNKRKRNKLKEYNLYY